MVPGIEDTCRARICGTLDFPVCVRERERKSACAREKESKCECVSVCVSVGVYT